MQNTKNPIKLVFPKIYARERINNKAFIVEPRTFANVNKKFVKKEKVFEAT